MPTRYKHKNGKYSTVNTENRSFISVDKSFVADYAEYGTKLMLTDDLRGGVLGEGWDVTLVRPEEMGIWIPPYKFLEMTGQEPEEELVDLRERLRKEPDFADAEEAAQYRDDKLNAAMHAFIQQGEITMGSETPYDNNRDGFKTVHYYNGQAVGNISDREIFFIIQELQAELKALKKLGKDKSKAVKAHNKRINRDINKLMTELDSRH